ncbi:MAG TPA: hypothetical protein PKZ83_17205 [bacterium]|nr:hypothetical protein [bacterium]HQJ66305.1 hypothetical protein [bacterium]
MPVSAYTILTTVFKKLDADTTLQGASYLNGTDRIEKGPRRRKGLTAPCITMKIGGTSLDTDDKVQDATIYINSYALDKSNGTPDLTRLSAIAGQVETLLDDASLTAASGMRYFNCYVTSPHGEAFLDPDFPDEHYVSTIIRVQCQST